MSRRKAWVEAYAVVRRDRFRGHEYDPDESSPPMVCGGEFSYTVKEVVLTREVAEREVERLNRQSRDDTRYFWQYTRLFRDGASFGEPKEHDDGS